MLSYIINHRGKTGFRLENLIFLVNYLNNFKNIEIIIVEQDSESVLSNLKFPNNCKHIFIKNSGLFNRSWGFNVGYKYSTNEYLAFGDNDVVITKDAYDKSIILLQQNKVVNPYSSIVDTTTQEANLIRQTNSLLSIKREGRRGINFCGGLVFFTKQMFEQIGGWDEDFRGWGGEDNALTFYKIPLILGKECMEEIDSVGYHLWHERNVNDTFQQKNYKNNINKLDWYKKALNSDIINSINLTSIGMKNKYE